MPLPPSADRDRKRRARAAAPPRAIRGVKSNGRASSKRRVIGKRVQNSAKDARSALPAEDRPKSPRSGGRSSYQACENTGQRASRRGVGASAARGVKVPGSALRACAIFLRHRRGPPVGRRRDRRGFEMSGSNERQAAMRQRRAADGIVQVQVFFHESRPQELRRTPSKMERPKRLGAALSNPCAE